jgi:hypothetical protein
MNAPEQDVNFPAQVLEEVDDWFERIVGSWFWLG